MDSNYVDNALQIFLDYYETHLCDATIPYPHVVSTLESLKAQGYILAIITNKPYPFVTPILESLAMDGLFSLILGGDSLAEKKPHPLPLLHTCEKLGISIKNTVMIGDSQNDILAANACGMDSVGVTYGYNYGEDIGVHKPTVVMNDFKDLLDYL